MSIIADSGSHMHSRHDSPEEDDLVMPLRARCADSSRHISRHSLRCNNALANHFKAA